MKAIVEFLLVCHPTGYGKSLCFALLPLVYDYLREVKGHISANSSHYGAEDQVYSSGPRLRV